MNEQLSMDYNNFLKRSLSTFDGLGDDAGTVALAREEAAAIINVCS